MQSVLCAIVVNAEELVLRQLFIAYKCSAYNSCLTCNNEIAILYSITIFGLICTIVLAVVLHLLNHTKKLNNIKLLLQYAVVYIDRCNLFTISVK